MRFDILRVLAICAALPSGAVAQTIQCKMDERSNTHYIASDIALALLEYDEVSVKDAIIAKTGKKAVLGNVSRESPQRLTISWEVRNVPTDPAEFRRYDGMIQVRLTIQKSNGAATMTVNDILYNRFSYRAAGGCKFVD